MTEISSLGLRPERERETELAARLLEALGRVRRRTRRLVGAPLDGPPLAPAQVELIRHVRRDPGCTVTEAAAALGLAPNTVSTLVGTLSRHGHLERTPDSTDRRSVRLTLTLTAQDRVERWRDHRAILIASALDQLPPADRAAISQALGSLERLADALDGEVEGEIR